MNPTERWLLDDVFELFDSIEDVAPFAGKETVIVASPGSLSVRISIREESYVLGYGEFYTRHLAIPLADPDARDKLRSIVLELLE